MPRARKNDDEDDDDRDDDRDGGDDDERDDDGPRRGGTPPKTAGRSDRSAGRAAFAQRALKSTEGDGQEEARAPANVTEPLTRAEAAKRLGIRPNTLAKWQREDRIEGVRDDHGNWWFDPVVVDAMRSEQETDDFTSAQLLDAARGIIKQQFNHHETMSRNMASLIEQAAKRETAMMGGFLGAMQQLLGSQTEWAMKAIDRASRLEAELDASHEIVEASKNQAAERELAKMVTETDIAMRASKQEETMAMLKSYAPTVLSIVARKAGLEVAPSADPLDASLRAAIGSLSVEQLTAVAQSGILNQSQLVSLGEGWKAIKADKNRAGDAATVGASKEPQEKT